MKPLADRLMSNVHFEPNSGCWLFAGQWNAKGYGRVDVGHGRGDKRKRFAHRISYELFNGSLGTNLQVCHTCDVPCCVNPSHLFLGTNSDNQIDSALKKRHGKQKLSPTDVAAIRARAIVGRGRTAGNLIQLATEYDVAYSTIAGIVNEKTRDWAHTQ